MRRQLLQACFQNKYLMQIKSKLEFGKIRSGPKHGNVRGDRCWQPPFTTPPIKLMSRLGSCCCFIVSPVLYLFGKDFSQFSISSPAVTCHGGISFRWDSPSHWVINTLTMICPRVFLCIKHDKKSFILNYFHCMPSPPTFL